MKNWTSKSLLTLAGFSLLGGCGHMTSASMDMIQSQNTAAEMAMVEASQTQSVVTLKDVLDADSQDIPTLTAIGYAVTSPARTQRSPEKADYYPFCQNGSDARSGRTDSWPAGGSEHNRYRFNGAK